MNMTQTEVKKFRLEPDRKKTRQLVLDDEKLSSLHEPMKVYTNPSWPISIEDTIVVSDVTYDLEAITKILDEAGEALGKPGAVYMKIETKLALDLHQYLKDIPRKILFDNRFWFYLYLCSPVFGVHRHDTTKNAEGQYQSQDRLWGDWRRIPYSWAYLSYYLADQVGISAAQFENIGSRLRMWILDQSPLVSKKLRKSFILKVITGGTGQDERLDHYWPKVATKFGSLNLDLLTDTDVEKLFATL